MKNIIVINAIDNCNCELTSSINDSTNSIELEIKSDISINPVLEINGNLITIDASIFEYTIPTSLYVGTGNLQFRIIDDNHIGNYFKIAKIKNTDGNLVISHIDNLNYTLNLIAPRNDTGVPIATDISLGVVKGGSNVGIKSDGTIWTEQQGIETISNLELDEICK